MPDGFFCGQGRGATSEIEVYDSYPVLTNSEEETAFARALALEVFGSDKVLPSIAPMNASEDFAFMLQARPGCYFLLGNGEKGGKHFEGKGKYGGAVEQPHEQQREQPRQRQDSRERRMERRNKAAGKGGGAAAGTVPP